MPTTQKSKVKRRKDGKRKSTSKRLLKGTAGQDVEAPGTNALVWEYRCRVSSQALADCQKDHFDLVRTNDYLISQLAHLEKDAIGINDYWEKESEKKGREITMMQEKLKIQAALALEEKNKLVSKKILLQDEVKKMKEKEAQIQQELTDNKVIKENADKANSENLIQLEKTLSEEMKRLEKELVEQYDQQINALKQEHCEAFAQLEEALQKEHDCQTENLKNATRRKKDMEKLARSVVKENIALGRQKELLETVVKNKKTEIKARKLQISELMAKVGSMEKVLEQEVLKIEQMEIKDNINLAAIEDTELKIKKMQKVIVEQEKEMQHVKQLASIIVKNHKEMEKFFYEALDHVRQEIAASRFRYKKEALQRYHRNFRKATAGKIKFPPIQTFHESLHSTNSVYKDMEAAAKWSHVPGSEVQLSDLTWEQKEQVLRLLFATMNGEKKRMLHKDMALCTCSKREELVMDTISHQSPETMFNPKDLTG